MTSAGRAELRGSALGVVCLHLVFGAIVRISGSGLGCGTTWPKCYGHWFPPLSRPDLIIEVMHRYLASIVTLCIVVLWVAAWRRRTESGVAGRGGVLRMGTAAVVTVLCEAGLGGVTVKLGNAPWTVVAHWVLAMLLLAILATATVRTGAMGGTGVRGEHAPRGFLRAAYVAAGGAFLTVAMGGLTANFPFAIPPLYAFFEELISGRIIGKEPRATLEEVRMGRKKMFVS